MSKGTKTLVLIFGSVLAVVLIMVLTTVIWWHIKSDDLKTAARDAANAGFAIGKDKDENQCLTASFIRMNDPAKQNATAAMVEGFWVAGCLESAKPSPQFCDGMPVDSSPITIGQWARGYCVKKGNNNPYCGGSLSMVPRHCATPDREQKIKDNGKPAG